jgi:CPA2 family monovalent cation:H+ antiporter-2
MLLVTVLGLCFGFCLIVIKLEYSVALGAFLIGAIMAESRHIHTIEKLIEPVKDMFIAIFFVTIGLLLDPTIIWQYALPISIISFAVMMAKHRCVLEWARRKSVNSHSLLPVLD